MGIFSLPGEIRNAIYTLTLLGSELVFTPGYRPVTENGPRAILLVSKKVRDDARPIFLSICMFRVDRLFVNTVQVDTSSRLRRITFDGSKIRLNSTVLRQRFPELRLVNIHYRPDVIAHFGSVAELKSCKKECCNPSFRSLLLNIIFFKEETASCWISDFYGRNNKKALMAEKDFEIRLNLEIHCKSSLLTATMSSRDFVLHLKGEDGVCVDEFQRAIKEDKYCQIQEVPVVLPTIYHVWTSSPRAHRPTSASST